MSLLCPTNALCGALVTVSHLQTHTVKKTTLYCLKSKSGTFQKYPPSQNGPIHVAKFFLCSYRSGFNTVPASRGPHRTVILFIQMQLSPTENLSFSYLKRFVFYFKNNNYCDYKEGSSVVNNS